MIQWQWLWRIRPQKDWQQTFSCQTFQFNKTSGDNYHHLQRKESPRDNPPQTLGVLWQKPYLPCPEPRGSDLSVRICPFNAAGLAYTVTNQKRQDATLSLIPGIDAAKYIPWGPKFSRLLKKTEGTEDTYLDLWSPNHHLSMFPPRKHSPAYFDS